VKAIVGLGNPGKKYENNRHNIGFWVVDEIARDLNIEFKRKLRYRALVAREKDLLLVKPRTYMNLSGEAILRIKTAYGLKLTDFLIVFDDVYLDLGVIRIRRSGASGGHNGLASVIEELSSNNFARLRVGIKADSYNPDIPLEAYVLKNFDKKEAPLAKEVSVKAAEAVLFWLDNTIEKTMHKYN